MPDEENVSRRDVLAGLAVGSAVVSSLTGVGNARERDPTFGTRGSLQDRVGPYGGEYVLERGEEYVEVMPVNVILLTDRSLDEIWRTLRGEGWTSLADGSLSGQPKYALDASGEPVPAELDAADQPWNFRERDRRTHASFWTFHEGDDERRNVSVAAHVDVRTPIGMMLDGKFSELVGDPTSAVTPGHRGEQFDAARERLVDVLTANGWREIDRVRYADDHGNEGRWRDHDGFAAVLKPADGDEGADRGGGSDSDDERQGDSNDERQDDSDDERQSDSDDERQDDSDASGGPVEIETGAANPESDRVRYVTFEGRIEGLAEDETARVGFEYEDYNAMWGETATEEVSGPGAVEFAITERMPYVGRKFPYRAVAAVEGQSGTERHVGETRDVTVPNVIDTVAVETVDVVVSGTSATVHGRVADFGRMETVLATAEVWRPGSNRRTTRTREIELSADGSPEFEVPFDGLEADAEYRARALAEIPVGPTYDTTYGNEVTFTTGGGDSENEETATTTESADTGEESEEQSTDTEGTGEDTGGADTTTEDPTTNEDPNPTTTTTEESASSEESESTTTE